MWGLWRADRGAAERPSGRRLAGALLAGFGLWHIVDGVLAHWVLGIHRIRLDSENLLLWDLVWFFAFGVAPLVVGWLLQRGSGRTPSLRGRVIALLIVTAGTAGAGAWSLRPPPDQPFTTVVFRPDFGPRQVLAALASVDARIVWTDPSMGVAVVAVAPDRRWSLYRRRAMLVSGSGVPAGCFNWSKA